MATRESADKLPRPSCPEICGHVCPQRVSKLPLPGLHLHTWGYPPPVKQVVCSRCGFRCLSQTQVSCTQKMLKKCHLRVKTCVMKAKPHSLCTLYVVLKGSKKELQTLTRRDFCKSILFRGLKGADINNIGYLLGILPDAFSICPY